MVIGKSEQRARRLVRGPCQETEEWSVLQPQPPEDTPWPSTRESQGTGRGRRDLRGARSGGHGAEQTTGLHARFF